MPVARSDAGPLARSSSGHPARFCSAARSPRELIAAFPTRLLSGLGALFFFILTTSWDRKRVSAAAGGTHRKPPYGIYMVHHGGMLIAVSDAMGKRVGSLVSLHSDGELAAQVAIWLGYLPARGSSSRRAVGALLGVTQLLEAGRTVAITADGPRGPRTVIKPGAIVAASRCGAPLIPIGLAADHFWELPSWDRFRVPKPFARVRVYYGEPCWPPTDTEAQGVETCRAEVEQAMLENTRKLEELLGVPEGFRVTAPAPGEPHRPRGRGLRST